VDDIRAILGLGCLAHCCRGVVCLSWLIVGTCESSVLDV
jgi:hypothetical protein